VKEEDRVVRIWSPDLLTIAPDRLFGRILGRQPAPCQPQPVARPQPDDLAPKRVDRRSQPRLFRRDPGCVEQPARSSSNREANQGRRSREKATHDREASDQRLSAGGSPPPLPAMLLPM